MGWKKGKEKDMKDVLDNLLSFLESGRERGMEGGRGAYPCSLPLHRFLYLPFTLLFYLLHLRALKTPSRAGVVAPIG
jgi:hypothetical protein